MAVRSTFDQWQKDVFFSAAEEVQESADAMESLYRIWIQSRTDELLRELQTALGTAKWQLEEFERAVRCSHDNYVSEENMAIARHRDFVAAIKSQIFRIEKEINDFLCKEGKQPLRWVHLDAEETDDLAAFLSGGTRNGLQSVGKASDFKSPSQVTLEPDYTTDVKDKIVKDERCAMAIARKESCNRKNNGVRIEVVEPQNDSGRTLISSDTCSWIIDICNGEDRDKQLTEGSAELPSSESPTSVTEKVTESATYLHCLKNSFRRVKSREHRQPQFWLSNYCHLNGVLQLVKGINHFVTRNRYVSTSNKDYSPKSRKLVGRVGGYQSHLHGSHSYSQYARSVSLTLLLVLTIVFVAPFVLYSS